MFFAYLLYPICWAERRGVTRAFAILHLLFTVLPHKNGPFIFRLVTRENKQKALDIMREVSPVTTQYMGGLLIVVLILAINASVFVLIYRFLPDISVRWNASWFGAAFTAILFSIGKYLIGIIIGNSNLGAIYGAASSFVVILMWIYFVSLILYFGVELTHQYSRFFEHENKPVKYAIPFEIKEVDD